MSYGGECSGVQLDHTADGVGQGSDGRAAAECVTDSMTVRGGSSLVLRGGSFIGVERRLFIGIERQLIYWC